MFASFSVKKKILKDVLEPAIIHVDEQSDHTEYSLSWNVGKW